MRDLIHGLVETEAAARRTVQSARAEAERLVNDARQQAQQILARGRMQTRAETDKLLENAVEQASQLKRERLQKAEMEMAERVQLDAAATEEIVQAVVRCICGESSLSARPDRHQPATTGAVR